MSTRTVAAGEFKARCLSLLDEVQASGDEIVITKRGRAVARLVPIAISEDEFALLRGSVHASEADLLAPTGEPWPGESAAPASQVTL